MANPVIRRPGNNPVRLRVQTILTKFQPVQDQRDFYVM